MAKDENGGDVSAVGDCSICLDKLRTPLYVSACNHTFHDACIQKLFSTGVHRCPLCRAQWETADNNGVGGASDDDDDDENVDRLDPSRAVAREQRAREQRERDAELDRLDPSRVVARERNRLRVFATNYNYLRVMSGFRGLTYTP